MRITKATKYLGTTEFMDFYRKFIRESSRGKRLQKDGSRIRQSTIDNYIYTYKLIEEFAKEYDYELRLYLINHLKAKEKEQAKKYFKKFFTDFTEHLYFKKDFYDNYVGLIIKSLRTFFNYINSELNIQVGDFHKSFYVPKEDVPIVVLSPEQLNYLIYDPELNSKMPEHLVPLKDIFVFGCTVALRFSDLMQLKKNNIQFYNNAHYLKVTSQKTNTNTTIKLPDYAVEILKKYHKEQRTLLPGYSKGYLNRGFKKLGAYINFKEPMEKFRTKRGVKFPIYKNKTRKQHYTLSDHITTHTMRRTAITTMLRLGMPDQLVRKISGHSANSKEFFRYVEFAQSYVDEHTDLVFDKITRLDTKTSSFLA
jgi:integrase